MEVEIYPEKYKHDNKDITPKDISSKLDQSIKNIIAKTGFIKYNIDKKPLCTNGGNYLGELYEIDIKGNTREGYKELNIFVKSVMPGHNELQIVSVDDIYTTEVFTYKELSKIFEEAQEEAHVPIDERYKMVKSYDETSSEAIIIENLSKKGFSTGHRMDVISLDFAEKAIQGLAKFHALSFVLKVKRPEFFETKIRTRKSPYNFGDQWQGFVQSIIKIPMSNINEDNREKVKKFCESIEEKYKRIFFDEKIQRCLCHGDYRPNNILTKIFDGEVSEIIPVDYQLMYYGCPVTDFLYFIMCSTDQEFRRAHLMNLKDLYHETMKKFLKYFDIDVNLVYSKMEFDEDYRRELDYGLMFAILLLAFIFASEDDVPDITKDEIRNIRFKVDDKYKDRLQGIINDYIEWDII